MFILGDWLEFWKLECVVPMREDSRPETEDDLRPISLTPFFSKVEEHFVVVWLLNYVGDRINIKQFGGLKGNATTHYILEFMNFILVNLDNPDQTAALACYMDYQNAFNRHDYNMLITMYFDCS